MSDDTIQKRRERVERIRHELELPCQSQWIRDDVRFLLFELDQIVKSEFEIKAELEQAELDREHGQRLLEVERYDREQAKRERDEWKLESERGKWPKEAAQEFHAMKAKLAKVRALIEKGKRLREDLRPAERVAAEIEWDEALAAFEQEQKPSRMVDIVRERFPDSVEKEQKNG